MKWLYGGWVVGFVTSMFLVMNQTLPGWTTGPVCMVTMVLGGLVGILYRRWRARATS